MLTINTYTYTHTCCNTIQTIPQVVIRVRPPLPRELQGFTEYQCTSMVDARSGQLITISENLPAVLSGQGASDGMLYATYRCMSVCVCVCLAARRTAGGADSRQQQQQL